MTKSILLVGVGGQGTILASKILTNGLMQAGYDVRMSEIHGMSQRGGSVSSHIRYGEEVFSPVIEEGAADMIVAFEKMEALRWLSYLKKDATIVVNDFEILPLPVSLGQESYSPGILPEMEKHAKVRLVPASKLADDLGNPKASNIILLGMLVKLMALDAIDWKKILAENIKPQFLELNQKAFDLGLQSV